MQHLDEGTIHAWLDGALPDDEAARVERHAAECAECASVVAEARGLVAGASRILSALDDVPVVVPRGAGREAWGVGGAIASGPVQGGPARLARRPLWSRPGALAAAASVVLMVGTAVVVTRGGGPSSRAVSEESNATPTTEFSVDTAIRSTRRSAAPAPSDTGADAAAGSAAAPSRPRPGGARGSTAAAAARREERVEERVEQRRDQRAADAAPAAPDVAGALRDTSPSRFMERREPMAAQKAAAMPAPAATRLESAVVTSRADSSPPPVAGRARSGRPGPTTGAAARSDSVAGNRVDTVTVEPPAPPSYRPEGRAGAAARPFPVTGCYEVLEGGLPRFITLKTNSVWSGVAEHAFVATADGAVGYWSQPRTGAVHLVIAGAVVTARVDASTGELRGTAQRGRKMVSFLAKRGCR